MDRNIYKCNIKNGQVYKFDPCKDILTFFQIAGRDFSCWLGYHLKWGISGLDLKRGDLSQKLS